MNLALPPITSNDPALAIPQIRAVFEALEQQLTTKADARIGDAKAKNAIIADTIGGNLKIGTADSKSKKTYVNALGVGAMPSTSTNKHYGVMVTIPTVATLANPGDWCFYDNGTQMYLYVNRAGIMRNTLIT